MITKKVIGVLKFKSNNETKKTNFSQFSFIILFIFIYFEVFVNNKVFTNHFIQLFKNCKFIRETIEGI